MVLSISKILTTSHSTLWAYFPRLYSSPATTSIRKKQRRQEEEGRIKHRTERFIQGKTGVWEITIGLEIHAQIIANTKLFSSAPTTFNRPVNTQVSFVDAALPGTLPVLNQHCVFQALRIGAALNGNLQKISRFDRKHYFYHDLPMGYQITQYFEPIVTGGELQLTLDDETTKSIRIERIQLETDSGKSIHDAHPMHTLVDLNRAGIGLFEIITRPDLSTPNESAMFLKKMIYLLKHINACNASMSEGSLRCDANVSVRPVSSNPNAPLGERCEIKNLNSIKALVNAIEYESKRQVALLEEGGQVDLETRWFDPHTKTTFTARKKEDRIDYRYFPEPDLPALIIPQEFIDSIPATLPLMPDDIVANMVEKYKHHGITPKLANLVTFEQGGVEYFTSVLTECPNLDPKIVALWITNNIFGFINTNPTLSLENFPITPGQLGAIIQMVEEEYISDMSSKNLMEFIIKNGDKRNPHQIVDENNWAIITMDEMELESTCKQLMDMFPDEVNRYRKGKTQLMQFFVGHMMKTTKGKVNAKKLQQVLEKLLSK